MAAISATPEISSTRPTLALPVIATPDANTYYHPIPDINEPKQAPHSKRRSTSTHKRHHTAPTHGPVWAVEQSLSPYKTLKSLRNHKWSPYDGQYLILAIIGIFCLCAIEEPGPITKTCIATLLLGSLVVPLTRQFFLPFLPIAAWLVLFYTSRFIPSEWRPSISVKVLPALENIVYGANLSASLSRYNCAVLDVLAWLPYGIFHYGAPAVCSLILFFCAPPYTVPIFARSLGYMNVIGVLMQNLLPSAPPWYINLYGLAPAAYTVHGSPGGLERIDALFGTAMYTATFTASPLAFGAFPSLHSACATLEAMFMAHAFPQLKPLLVFYVLWVWWATMYLTHHFFVDLVGGSCLAFAVWYYTKRYHLPQRTSSRAWRWSYDTVVFGHDSTASDNADSDEPKTSNRSSSRLAMRVRKSSSATVPAVWTYHDLEAAAKTYADSSVIPLTSLPPTSPTNGSTYFPFRSAFSGMTVNQHPPHDRGNDADAESENEHSDTSDRTIVCEK